MGDPVVGWRAKMAFVVHTETPDTHSGQYSQSARSEARSGSVQPYTPPRTVLVIADLWTGKVRRVRGCFRDPARLAWSPNGLWFLCAMCRQQPHESADLYLLDDRTDQLRTVAAHLGTGDDTKIASLTPLAWSPDDTRFLVRAAIWQGGHKTVLRRDFCVDVDLKAAEVTKPGFDPFFTPFARNQSGTAHRPRWYE